MTTIKLKQPLPEWRRMQWPHCNDRMAAQAGPGLTAEIATANRHHRNLRIAIHFGVSVRGWHGRNE